MATWKWIKDKVLPTWDATDDASDISLYVRRHGQRRFSWHASTDLQVESGCDEISGSAVSMKQAKAMAEAAAKRLEQDPTYWSVP